MKSRIDIDSNEKRKKNKEKKMKNIVLELLFPTAETSVTQLTVYKQRGSKNSRRIQLNS